MLYFCFSSKTPTFRSDRNCNLQAGWSVHVMSWEQQKKTLFFLSSIQFSSRGTSCGPYAIPSFCLDLPNGSQHKHNSLVSPSLLRTDFVNISVNYPHTEKNETGDAFFVLFTSRPMDSRLSKGYRTDRKPQIRASCDLRYVASNIQVCQH